ncbi:unnamed protein product [Aureobasidium vineae]|uniref:Uncharacterized protein n=1 Tax=Aureobasidium vineae TaxID=2773715 RepID=A0A9N8PJ82_9PEZI|nr:unnamed protein product [Aureobasidium vineae]
MLPLQRNHILFATLLVFIFITLYHLLPQTQETTLHSTTHNENEAAAKRLKNPELHVLLPTTIGDVNLCKTMLSAKAMGYPEPVILGWGDTFDTWYLLAGGSHLAKISRVLEYLESMSPEQEDDLVLMMDAFDIWFQLPPETLIERYYSINEKADKRISERMGKAAEVENIKQTIIFGAGKRCAPNQLHSIACYPVPASPVPDDIYGANTDTIMGHNPHTSHRQRYLNSGYIIGPVKDMREMFRTAWDIVQNWPTPSPDDNGSGSMDLVYHASDQSVFAIVFGQQEYQREVLRRRHSSSWTWQHKKTSPVNKIEGTVIQDILNPAFTHEKMEALEGRSYEYGIGLDYFSDLGHQTANSEKDSMWMRYDDSPDVFLDKTRGDNRNDFDCEYQGDYKIPSDMKMYDETTLLPNKRNWEHVNLYTHLCMGTIPVMAHFNSPGQKAAREYYWPLFWVQQYGKWIVENSERLGRGRMGATAWKKDEQPQFLDWDTLCPAEYSEELYRGSDLALS